MARYDGIADWYDTEFLGELHDHGREAAAFTSAGLSVEHFEEDGEDDYPYLVALLARR